MAYVDPMLEGKPLAEHVDILATFMAWGVMKDVLKTSFSVDGERQELESGTIVITCSHEGQVVHEVSYSPEKQEEMALLELEESDGEFHGA